MSKTAPIIAIAALVILCGGCATLNEYGYTPEGIMEAEESEVLSVEANLRNAFAEHFDPFLARMALIASHTYFVVDRDDKTARILAAVAAANTYGQARGPSSSLPIDLIRHKVNAAGVTTYTDGELWVGFVYWAIMEEPTIRARLIPPAPHTPYNHSPLGTQP